MRRTVLKAKIHRATVTKVFVDYEGSLGLDEELIEKAEMIPYERVDVYNISNGERFSTYLIKEEGGSGKVNVYGAAAHKVQKGDRLIIASYVLLDEGEMEFFMPKILILDEQNRIKEVK